MAQIGNDSRIAMAAGSGWITRPRDTALEDRMYVVFDRAPPGAVRELTDADLYDATDAKDAMPPDAPGWYVRFESHGAGEKVAGTDGHLRPCAALHDVPAAADRRCSALRTAEFRCAHVRTRCPHGSAPRDRRGVGRRRA